MQRLAPIAAAVLALSACAAPSSQNARPGSVSMVEEAEWHTLVSAQDEQRITHLPDSWRSMLHAVPPRFQGLVTREGDLLSPDAGRDHPTPPPGSYRCRLVKLTPPASQRIAPVKRFPDFFCYIRGEENNELSFTKQTGTELPRGWLHQDSERRLILIGARQREAGDTLAYGKEQDRDVVGVVERIGPFRWRLVIAGRDARAGLDIYELTPVPSDQQVEEPRTPTPADRPPATIPGTGPGKSSAP